MLRNTTAPLSEADDFDGSPPVYLAGVANNQFMFWALHLSFFEKHQARWIAAEWWPLTITCFRTGPQIETHEPFLRVLSHASQNEHHVVGRRRFFHRDEFGGGSASSR